MTDQKQSKTAADQAPFVPLVNALRREAGDAKILELVETLRARGYDIDVIVSRVTRAIAPSAGVRVQKVAQQRAQYMATGTWKRYKTSRSKRLRLWLREALDVFGGGTRRRRRTT